MKRRRKEPVEAAEPAVTAVTAVPAAVEQAAQLLAALPSREGAPAGLGGFDKKDPEEERNEQSVERKKVKAISMPAEKKQQSLNNRVVPSATSNHKILGVHVGATEAELKMAYNCQAASLHPDAPTGNSKKFLKCLAAYRALLDDLKKQSPVACVQSSREWIASPGLLLLLLREASPEEWHGLLASASYQCLFDALDLAADQEALQTVLSQPQDIWA